VSVGGGEDDGAGGEGGDGRRRGSGEAQVPHPMGGLRAVRGGRAGGQRHRVPRALQAPRRDRRRQGARLRAHQQRPGTHARPVHIDRPAAPPSFLRPYNSELHGPLWVGGALCCSEGLRSRICSSEENEHQNCTDSVNPD
jgi:hypothetical protein